MKSVSQEHENRKRVADCAAYKAENDTDEETLVK